MPLKLTITSFQRLSPGQESTKFLDRGSLTIGRAAQNNWILQDPERILSSNHCVIHSQDGGYYLTDTSTNGTFLNDSEQRIPRNQTVRLNEGDHFVLGEYEIEVNLMPGAAELSPSKEESVTDSITDLVLMPPGIAPPGEQGPLEFRPPAGLPVRGAVATEPPPEPLMPERAAFEPPELMPGAPPAPPAPTPIALVPEPVEPAPVERLLPAPSHADLEPPFAAIPDHLPAPAVAQPAAEPAVAPIVTPAGASAGAIIPDDWWLAPPAAPIAPQPAGPAVPPLPASPLPEPAPVQTPPLEPVRVQTPPLEPARVQTLAPAPAELAGIAAETLFQAFLRGASLPLAPLTADQQLEIMANLGAIFRETVQGLTDILLARGDVKGEFRLDRTAIGPVENNPLKTPPGRPPLGPEEIMSLLLIRQKAAYMSPVQAVHEGFNDIKAHQLAVMAGIQAALNRLLERFDPRNLETRLEQTVLDSILPTSRKAKYWDLFTTEYQAIAREAEDDFNELFGDEFARAYEERLRARS